jgi:hypothetical protein
MTGHGSTGTRNPTPRVSRCIRCGERFAVGPRGPLPRSCSICRRPRVLCHRIGAARNAALRADAPAALVDLLTAALDRARMWRDSQ